MATGTGQDASIGFAEESSFGVYTPPDHFYEFDSEGLNRQKRTIQGIGLKAGSLYPRSSRRKISTRDAKGPVTMDVPSAGLGVLLKSMLGTSSTTNSGAVYTQVHTPGGLKGRSLTCQVGKPSADGTINPFTYTGTKILSWEVSISADQLLKLALDLDAMDELSLANSPVGLAVANVGTAGSTTYGYRVSALGQWGESAPSATVTTTTGNATLNGTNKNTVTWTAYTLNGVAATGYKVYGRTASGEQFMKTLGAVTTYTDDNTDTPTAPTAASLAPQLVSPTYSTTASAFSFLQTSLLLNGSSIASVKKASVKHGVPSKTDRFYVGGSGLKAEQVGNANRTVTGSLEAEFTSRAALYDAFQADADLSFRLTALGDYISGNTPYKFDIYIPRIRLDGDTPNVAGPDILTQTVPFTGLDDGTNAVITVTYVTSDTTY